MFASIQQRLFVFCGTCHNSLSHICTDQKTSFSPAPEKKEGAICANLRNHFFSLAKIPGKKSRFLLRNKTVEKVQIVFISAKVCGRSRVGKSGNISSIMLPFHVWFLLVMGARTKSARGATFFCFEESGGKTFDVPFKNVPSRHRKGKKKRRRWVGREMGCQQGQGEKEKAKSQPMGLEIGAKTEGRRKWNFLPPKMEEKASQGAKTAKNPFKGV